MNKNAHIGRKIEILFKNSINNHTEVIEKIQQHFKINGKFLNAISTGLHGEKADVKMEFSSGRNIDVNIKAYKSQVGFNQLTRTSIARFCDLFKINKEDQLELVNCFINKSIHRAGLLFPLQIQKKWLDFFTRNAPTILKWCFSHKKNREILVLYERDKNVVKVYPMRHILNKLSQNISFTKKGNVNIGSSVLFQRKGGNGSLSKHIPKNDIKHPGNNVQLKLRINEFLVEMKKYKIVEYFM